jgi:hypothetical protein
MTPGRPPLEADPDVVRRAVDSLRDAVEGHGPAALIPAAHGRLTVAVRCLAHAAAQLDACRPATARLLIEEIRLAVAELDAYDAARRNAGPPADDTPPPAGRTPRPVSSSDGRPQQSEGYDGT